MKGKSWLKYLVYAVLLVAVLYLRNYVGVKLQGKNHNEFKFDVVLMAIEVLINIGVGAVLGGEHLINEIRKTGKWNINLPKIIILGLPTLYISLAYLGYWISNPILNHLISNRLLYLIMISQGSLLLFQVILGYVVITSFYKSNKNADIIIE